MATVERKQIKLSNETYIVSRTEYPDRTVYVAWEKSGVQRRTGTAFIVAQDHVEIFTDENKQVWGAIDKRSLPQEIQWETPKSEKRLKMERAFKSSGCLLGATLIEMAFPVKCDATDGRAIIMGKNAVRDEPKAAAPTDKVRDLLAVADFPQLIRLANLNGVPVKPTDKPGLLKMRLSNALRNKIDKGGKIVEK